MKNDLTNSKRILLVSSVLIAVAAATLFCPCIPNGATMMPIVLMVLAVLQLVVVLGLKGSGVSSEAESQVEEPVVPAPIVASRDEKTEAELVHLLGLLQENGRFIDFVMDDITAVQDAQVAAAARVVHQGCRKFVKENFEIEPVASTGEGESVTLQQGYAAGEYRLLGNVGAEPPHTGTLLHRGWKVNAVSMSRLTDAAVEDGSLPVIAPAEVEVK